MRITSSMLASDAVKDDAVDFRRCAVEKTDTAHVLQKVMVYTSGGARSMRFWVCENHPLPENGITDNPDKEI